MFLIKQLKRKKKDNEIKKEQQNKMNKNILRNGF
jgi:hypothetical protein